MFKKMNKFQKLKEDIAWWLLVRATYWWANRYMDQWDKFRVLTDCGLVYVALDRSTPYPDSYYAVDRNGKPLR